MACHTFGLRRGSRSLDGCHIPHIGLHWPRGSFPAQTRVLLDAVGGPCSEEFLAGDFHNIRDIERGGCFLSRVTLDLQSGRGDFSYQSGISHTFSKRISGVFWGIKTRIPSRCSQPPRMIRCFVARELKGPCYLLL